MKLSYTRQAIATAAWATAAALALTLTGCGGGGGGSDSVSPTPAPTPTPTPTPVPAQATAALQGIWQSPAGAASTLSAVVLPDGALWTVVTNGGVTRLVKASLSAQPPGFAGAGKSYTLGGSAATNNVSAAVTASVVERSSLSGLLTVAGGQPEAFALAYQSRYDTPAVLAEFAGAWQATLGAGVVNWTLGSTGALTGTRTTGCTYTGQLSVRAEPKAVLTAAVTENCAGTVVQLDGVALFNADKSRITMLLATADGATGVALNLGR